jgi:hypothetical protein
MSSLLDFSIMLESKHKGSCDVDCRHHCERNVSLLVLWCIDLLPHNLWHPDLENVGNLVHGSNGNSTLFIIIGANFVGPTEKYLISNVLISTCFKPGGKQNIRHAETSKPVTRPSEDETAPFPVDRDIPNC